MHNVPFKDLMDGLRGVDSKPYFTKEYYEEVLRKFWKQDKLKEIKEYRDKNHSLK